MFQNGTSAFVVFEAEEKAAAPSAVPRSRRAGEYSEEIPRTVHRIGRLETSTPDPIGAVGVPGHERRWRRSAPGLPSIPASTIPPFPGRTPTTCSEL